jgi:hypothetical protein
MVEVVNKSFDVRHATHIPAPFFLTLHSIHGAQRGTLGLICWFACGKLLGDEMVEVKPKFFIEFLFDSIPAQERPDSKWNGIPPMLETHAQPSFITTI